MYCMNASALTLKQWAFICPWLYRRSNQWQQSVRRWLWIIDHSRTDLYRLEMQQQNQYLQWGCSVCRPITSTTNNQVHLTIQTISLMIWHGPMRYLLTQYDHGGCTLRKRVSRRILSFLSSRKVLLKTLFNKETLWPSPHDRVLVLKQKLLSEIIYVHGRTIENAYYNLIFLDVYTKTFSD